MRRVAVRALRSARYTTARHIVRSTRATNFNSHVLGARLSSSSSRPQHATTPKPNSMFIRRFSYALGATLVGTGALYAMRGGPSELNKVSASAADQARALTASAVYSNSNQAPPTAQPSEESLRKAVVVTANQIYTGVLEGDGPVSKYTDDGHKVLEMLTPEQATQKLRRNEESYFVGRGKGVVRYDVVQIPSNDPIEDDHSEKIVEVPGVDNSSDWMFWGVYDGHSGWTTSAKLRQVLISFVARELNNTYSKALTDPSVSSPSPEAVEAAIKAGFTRLDHEITNESVEKVFKQSSKRVAAELLGPALSGSCALLSFYDSKSELLRVACTGDSRAVLGRRGENGKWTATPLSVDQTGSNPDEEARMRKLHPGEDHVIRNGRVLGGLEPTRAFGDASYKWTREVSERLKNSFFARTPSSLLRTPPYVTAEPVVTTTKIQPDRGDFVVMATDGLWEMLTNEEVVGLVGQWIESQTTDAKDSTANSWLKMFSKQQKNLPVEHPEASKVKGGQKTPIRVKQWGLTGGEDERFVVEDKNVATHLVRNALGGKNTDHLCALLTLPSPFSRRYRDDLTVEVIFFGNGEKSGDVIVNKDASATASESKAKL